MVDLTKLSEIDYQNTPKILSVKNLKVNFKSDSGLVHAVRGVSFDLYKGETLCIVGESGSGKSVTSKTIMGILANNAVIESGEILYEGEDLVRVSEEEFHRIRGHKIGMIFQDPLSSLNPIMKVGKQIIEATMINSNILKKHYNELISKELVAYRNVLANKEFEISKIDEDIKYLVEAKKRLKKIPKENEKYSLKINKLAELLNVREKSKYHEEISMKVESLKDAISSNDKFIVTLKDYFNNIAVRYENELMDINNNILKFEKLTTENSEIKEINTLKLSLLKEKSELIVSLKEQKFNLDDLFISIDERIAALKKAKTFYVKEYKALSPLLKDLLNRRKKVAKVENKEYAAELKKQYESDLYGLKIQEESLKDRIEIYASTHLKPEELERYNKMLQEEKDSKSFFKNLFVQQHDEINISKVTKEEEKITSTGNEEFDNLLEQYKTVQNKIRILNNEYITKTKITKKEATKMALEVMKEVGIPLPEKRFKQYPFEFSGGMRQRIVIAIALTANPDILICDEPTTALDVTIQAQILELINKLKRERGLSCIFITHDLGVVANMADRVAVMYAGKIVEYGTSAEIFYDPKHPYTWSLLSSIPDVDSKEKLDAIPGTPPDLRFPPEGDAFALRSKYALAIDFKYEPPFFKVSDTHYAATWLLHEKAPKVEMPKIVETRIKEALKGVK